MMGETFTFSITPPTVFRHKSVCFRWKYFITCNPQSLIQLIHFPCAMCNVHTYLHYIHFLYQIVHLHPNQCSLARCVSIDRVAANKVNMTTLSNTVTPVLLETPLYHTPASTLQSDNNPEIPLVSLCCYTEE